MNLMILTGGKVPPEQTAVALGFFDGLHLGHMAVINSVLDRGELAPAVFTFDDKTPLPKLENTKQIITWKVKTNLLEQAGIKYLFPVDFNKVKSLSGEDFVKKVLVDNFNAKLVACGFDFRFGKFGSCNCDQLIQLGKPYGIEVVVVPVQKYGGNIISSTQIRELVRDGHIPLANKMLGYPLTYSLKVIHGHKVGRTLNFPTINQAFPDNCLVPKEGVYSSAVLLDGKKYMGVTSIGVRPTFTAEPKPIMETFIVGFSGDLYGKEVEVSLMEFIREQVKFDTIPQLKKQIQQDIDFILKK